jgi:hypothetical protein
MTAEDRMTKALKFIIITGVVILALAVASLVAAFAQEHGHRPQDMALHNSFYRTWMMPDNRAISCCHEEDCRPAEAYQKDGVWYARQDGDKGDFTPVPPEKVEQDRDSPDGRSHLCGRRYGFDGSRFSVFCFLPASGS